MESTWRSDDDLKWSRKPVAVTYCPEAGYGNHGTPARCSAADGVSNGFRKRGEYAAHLAAFDAATSSKRSFGTSIIGTICLPVALEYA